MIIRDETPEDAPAIRHVNEAAFGQAAEADLIDALRASGYAEISLVAVEGVSVVGHILFSRLESPSGCLALAPVAVLPERQGGGIGSGLIRAGIAAAREGGWGAVFLLGEPEYYERFGFRVDLAAPFETPYPRDYVMALELEQGFLGASEPVVTYAPAFGDLG